MQANNQLYKKLLENAPYGTLFFAYGVCIDANPKALSILRCQRSDLIGTSLYENFGDATPVISQLRKVVTKVCDEKMAGVMWRSADALEDEEVMVVREPIDDRDDAFSIVLFPLPAIAQLVVEEFDSSSPSIPQVEAEVTSSPNWYFSDEDHGDQAAEVVLGEDESDIDLVEHIAEEETVSLIEEIGEADDVEEEQALAAPAEIPPSVVIETSTEDEAEKLSVSSSSKSDVAASLPASREMLRSIGNYLDLYRDDNACGALLLIDLDHFNSINETLGNQVATQILDRAAGTIEGMLTDKMEMDRVAGDAFLLFIRDLEHSPTEVRDVVLSIANEIRRIIARPFFTESGEIIVTASVGVSLLFERLTTAETAIQQAESAMFEAKRRGRDTVVLFDSQITRQAQQRINLQSSLRRAVTNQEFDLYVQPQVSIATGEVVGGEALLRWIHPGHAMHTPADFIPVLESSGMILDVGQWVIRTCCEYLRNLLDVGLWNESMRMGVNISPRQFHDPNLITVLEHSLKSYDIKPEMMTLEVTENLLIDDFEHVVDKMRKIRDMGLHFSIDDFGSGYSSMIYLKRLPLDGLKIDREFIANIHRDKDTRGLVEAIMMLSRHYGLSVVAEGVEKREALQVLSDLGCGIYQGAHFSMPVPMEKFQKLVAA